MNPRRNDGGLSLSLRTDLRACRSTTGRNKRHHDGSHSDSDGGIAISVPGVAARLTDKAGLTLAVRFCTVAALATRPRRIVRVYRVQWNASKSGLVGQEETELPK